MDRLPYSYSVQQFMQFRCDAAAGAWSWAKVAESHSSAIIGTHTAELGRFGLNKAPIKQRAAEPRVQNHRRRACTHAPEVEPVATNIYQLSRRRIRRQIPAAG